MNRRAVTSGRAHNGGQAGFGLIEVLAAVLILAIGVIGFGALQVRAVQASGDSYFRTQAISIAQDLAERAMVNRAQMANYTLPANWPVDQAVTGIPTACITAACTATQMATYDVLNARYNAQVLLPQGLVNMEPCKNSSLVCVYVAWDGITPTSGVNGLCVDDNGLYKAPPANMPLPALPCVMLEVQP